MLIDETAATLYASQPGRKKERNAYEKVSGE
jgi:hypothetical protein